MKQSGERAILLQNAKIEPQYTSNKVFQVLYPVYNVHKRLTKVLTMINLISEDQEAKFSLETKIRKKKISNPFFRTTVLCNSFIMW